ncbi:hypothetical protein JGH11_16960 [Dysgonomonas sp. Marseille-P4677]|uniref:hypothetical protein n=1 Tax=Dysgonomonas sp. Marseille-P4677 TaxID=2364790 RepID=UPI001913B602|nr:hypothetical protein [Dysgonomonas sp. Marseille-P4677]MBK5722566.1 hypothetical protein [Dysgonomonas sp. Marseille-P4677]
MSKKRKHTKKQLEDALRAYLNSQRRHVNRLYKNYLPELNKIFKDAEKQVEELYKLYLEGRVSLNKVFYLTDYPEVEYRVKEIQKQLQKSLDSFFITSITKEWTNSNKAADNLVKVVFPSISKDKISKYYQHNEKALNAFLNRNIASEGTRTISGRVWKLTNQYRRDIEDTLAIGIQQGDSAQVLAKRLNKYLNKPSQKYLDAETIADKKVRNEIQQRIEAKQGGQGVYNSAYKNARRLAANETNLAYRNAESERIEQLDFVVGYEIKVSNSHEAWLQKVWIPKHGSKPEICDVLAGKYPKSFKWNSWHVSCKCFRITILKTIEELQEDNTRILRGEEVTTDSVNAVKEMPKAFRGWITDNTEKITNAKSKPIFWENNLSLIKSL